MNENFSAQPSGNFAKFYLKVTDVNNIFYSISELILSY